MHYKQPVLSIYVRTNEGITVKQIVLYLADVRL